MEEKKVAIYLSKSLYDKVRRRFEERGGEFKGVDGYVEFVLREVIKEDGEAEKAYTREDDELIKKRLKNLGYL